MITVIRCRQFFTSTWTLDAEVHHPKPIFSSCGIYAIYRRKCRTSREQDGTQRQPRSYSGLHGGACQVYHHGQVRLGGGLPTVTSCERKKEQKKRKPSKLSRKCKYSSVTRPNRSAPLVSARTMPSRAILCASARSPHRSLPSIQRSPGPHSPTL